MSIFLARTSVACLLALALAGCESAGVREPYPYAEPYYYPGGGYPGGGYYYYGGGEHDARGNIRQRVDQADQSIDRGAARGNLTREEARGLRQELETIRDKIDQMKDDGRFTQRERERIDRDLDRLQRNIRREKRDDERRNR